MYKTIFLAYLCLPGADYQIRTGTYTACGVTHHNSYKLSTKLMLNHEEQWMWTYFKMDVHVIYKLRTSSLESSYLHRCTSSCLLFLSVSFSFERSTPWICGNTSSKILLIFCWLWSSCGNPGLHHLPKNDTSEDTRKWYRF